MVEWSRGSGGVAVEIHSNEFVFVLGIIFTPRLLTQKGNQKLLTQASGRKESGPFAGFLCGNQHRIVSDVWSADMRVVSMWRTVTEGCSSATTHCQIPRHSSLCSVLRLMQFGRNVFQRLLIGGINFDSQSLL